MPSPRDCYDPEMLALMTEAFNGAWQEAEYALANSTFDPTGLRTMMSVRSRQQFLTASATPSASRVGARCNC